MKHTSIPSILTVIAVAISGTSFAVNTKAEPAPYISLATTTSTENSGLLAYLNPLFTRSTGIEVRVIAKGSGAALAIARNGDADIVMAHSPADEEKFVADGFGIERAPLMYNDFVLVGPKTDPAAVNGLDIVEAFRKLAAGKATFISRGDNSGTHVKELELWQKANAVPQGSWYLSIGQGMSRALEMAQEKDGYTLTDRGTYVAMRQHLTLTVVSQGSPLLKNNYSIILVNPAKQPHVKVALSRRYRDYLLSAAGQTQIAAFKVNGEQLFYPLATPSPLAEPGSR